MTAQQTIYGYCHVDLTAALRQIYATAEIHPLFRLATLEHLRVQLSP